MSPSSTPPQVPPPETPPQSPRRPRRRLHVEASPVAAARACADEIADLIRTTADPQTPSVTVAFSGGTTPSAMFRALAERVAEDAATAAGWARTRVFQVDERIAPDGDPQRNANDLTALLLDPTGVEMGHRHLMPVNRPNPSSLYSRTLERVAPAGLDVVVLGLGDDGHTASLVPGDPVLDVTDTLVVTTGVYRGTRRLTLTRAALDRAGLVLWLVTGPGKADPLRRLMHDDRTIPAGLVDAPEQIVFADRDAAALVTDQAD